MRNDKKMRKPRGYWTEDNTIKELEFVIKELGHFPTQKELQDVKKSGLSVAITKHGGFDVFRIKMGQEITRKPSNYWTDENIIKELEIVIEKFGHFPTHTELENLKMYDLGSAITRHGGYPHFREIMGHEFLNKPIDYWSEDNTIKELEVIIKKINHFPRHIDLKNLNRTELSAAMAKCGGINHFREIMGYEFIHKPNGYWTEENVRNELKIIIEEFGHFPTFSELENMDRYDLKHAITKYGGMPYFWNVFNINVDEIKRNQSLISSYIVKRGSDCESIVKHFITIWSKRHGFPEPDFNVKLAKSKMIEFVCETNKKIGIDVTNTKNKTGEIIRRKWKRKEYHLHLDELWIVVFSNAYKDDDYVKFNERSPENVKVMSIETFMEELNITVDERMELKINVYNECTFHTKDKLKQSMPEKKPLSKVFKMRPDIRIKLKK